MTETMHFGPFEADPRSGELRREGVVVPLPPQPFRLLVALLERPGELVTREELRQKVWDDGTFVDYDRGLNFCVLQVRTALGDDAKSPTYIETLPKRGYRFIGEVGGSAPVPGTPPTQARAGRAHSTVVGIALAALAAILLPILLFAAWQRRADAPGNPKLRIAVLPFENLSGANDAHFADGMTEELITHLGRLQPRRLGVIARTSILTYRGTTKSVKEIGKELGVGYVVEGSVRRDGERVRVTAQLIETDGETHIWAESFDRNTAGALAIQEDVARRIASAMKLELLDDDRAPLTATNPAAHEAYLRGRHLWHERKTASIEASVAQLREAIRLEPGFVLPYVALADTLHALAMRDVIEPREAGSEIRRATENALRLAPRFAQSHSTAALLHFWYEWNWEAAEASYREAIALNPGEPGALHDHGWLLITRGAYDEGIAEIRRAQQLDPVSPRANMHVAWAYIYTGQYDRAIAEARRALALSPDFAEALGCIEHAYLLRGDYVAALAARREKPAGVTDAKAWYTTDLRRRADTLEASPDADRDPYNTAATLAMAGERERAIRWLARAKERRSTSFPLVGVDPKLRKLHGHPEFEKMVVDVGLMVIR